MNRKKIILIFCLIVTIAFFTKLFWPFGEPPIQTIKIEETQDINLNYYGESEKIHGGGHPGCNDWAPLIEFTPPVTPFLVRTIEIGACLKPEVTKQSVLKETFEIEIWDENLTVIGTSIHSISIFNEFPNPDWTEIDIPDVEVNSKFYILTWFGNNYNKIYIGAGEDSFPYGYCGRKGGIIKDKKEDLKKEHSCAAGWYIAAIGTRAPNVIIKLVGINNTPIPNVNVGLWKSPGVINNTLYETGGRYTNSDGIVSFHVPPDDYLIILNLRDLPEGYIYTEKIKITVTQEGITQKTVQLQTKNQMGTS